jgi:hypothetical protein
MLYFFLEKKGFGSEMVEIGIIVVNHTLCRVKDFEKLPKY